MNPLPVAALDAIARLARRVLDMPVALVTVADADGARVAASAGTLGDGWPIRRLAPWGGFAFDAALARRNRPLIIPDLAASRRFRDNTLVVTAPFLRFYAGVPLRRQVGETHATLCVLDRRPRSFGRAERATLADLAASTDLALALPQPAPDARQPDLDLQWLWTAAPDGRLLEVDPQAVDLTGLPIGNILGSGLPLLHPDDAAVVLAGWHRALRSGETYDAEHRVRSAGGGYRWCQVRAAPRRVPTGGIVCWHGITRDIHEQQLVRPPATAIVVRDGLTGLGNRLYFRQVLERQVAQVGRGSRFALLRLDLDDFRSINDTLGNATGDALLVQVAERLAACVREVDTVARDGGDAFLVLLGDLQRPEDAVLLAERILGALRTPFSLDGHSLSVGASIGITLCPLDGSHLDTLLQNADLALERARNEARGGYRFFEPAMDETLRTRQALRLDLGDALDRGQFTLAYQPILGAGGSASLGFEALLRWHHPTRGMVSPNDFIPVAEKSGLIAPIGRWVLEQACREAVSWPAGTRLAVNLSAMQFRQCDLPRIVAACLASSGLPPHRLELEITESLPLLDDDDNLDVLRRLRALGTRIVLDDFGAGYASLGYLQRFPFDKLKIDRSFIARMTAAGNALTIVQAVLRMAQALGIAVTAEGVETRAQLDMLAREACDEMQGFFFSRPVPPADVPPLIDRLAHRSRQEAWFNQEPTVAGPRSST